MAHSGRPQPPCGQIRDRAWAMPKRHSKDRRSRASSADAVRLVRQTPVLNLEAEWAAATRCLLRIDAKQCLQWITHGTFEKRTIQSQMLLGYLQFNDFGECLEPGSSQGVEIVGKGLVHVTHGNGLAVPSPDVPFIGLIDTGKVASSL